MKNIIFALVLCLLIQGCVSTTTVKLVPQVLKGQKIINQDGDDAVISHKKKSSVAVRPPAREYSSEGRPMIFVLVYGTEKPFDFSTEDIQIFVDGNPHRVFTYDELAAEIKLKEASAAGAVSSEYDERSRKGAKEGYKSSSDPEVFSPSDNSNTIGDTSKYGYKYDVSSVARDQSATNAQLERDMKNIEMQTQQALNVLDSIMLKKTTVLPNMWHRGYVTIEKIPDPAQSHEIKVIVTVAGEEHEFLLNHFKAQ